MRTQRIPYDHDHQTENEDRQAYKASAALRELVAGTTEQQRLAIGRWISEQAILADARGCGGGAYEAMVTMADDVTYCTR
jgi:hypothetical protein